MKSRLLISMSTVSLLTALSMPIQLVAQNPPASQQQKPKPVRYTVTDLGTLDGGTFSEPFSLNKNGGENGVAGLPDGTQHAVLWLQGQIVDLDTLGGRNSIAFGGNGRVQSVGEAETSTPDPKGEDFCGFGTHLICLPFLWERGVMAPLPTLGGNNGGVNMINNSGEAAGFAENSRPDPACPTPQVLHFKPVVWENGAIHRLPTFRRDPEGVALGINDRGQVVGASGSCAPFNTHTLINLLPRHALLWEDGRLTDLGNLGGTSGQAGGNIAWSINNRGQVIGVSDLPGDTTFHAFQWTKAAGMRDLGTLSGDVASTGSGINDAGSVVGLSLDASFNPRAFLWQKGVMTDLNTLTTDSSLFLLLACSINSRGEIAGLGATSTGEVHAYLATPIHPETDSESAARAAQGVTNKNAGLAENVRELLQERLRFVRFGARIMDPQ